MNKQKYYWLISWLIFGVISVLLFLGYFYSGKEHGEELSLYLKGITTLEHFGIHYTVGLFFGLLFLLFFWKKQWPEPIILGITILWSHFPDLVVFLREVPQHQSWENIFFFHPVVDEFRQILFIALIIDVILAFLYLKLKRKNCEKVKIKLIK
ncbi:hypothetical protein J4421_05590 [Candidatus Woesearchaeota archaeon]|nr:hypothetical protein [Candidatus Woesearchaeota archaeon]